MKFYPNPAEDDRLAKWIKSNWGIGRLFRRMKYYYSSHGQIIILRSIITVAAKQGKYYSRRSILRVMNEYDFTRQEKNCVLKWVDGKEKGDTWVYCREHILLQKAKQDSTQDNTPFNEINPDDQVNNNNSPQHKRGGK
jgi:hypothetical protein